MSKSAWMLLSLSVFLPSCGSIDVTSTFRNRDIVIDANAEEWAGLPLRKEKNVSFTVCNDSSYLYLLLTASDRGLERQIAMTGLDLWFDPSGGSDKVFGIRFPVHMPGDRAPGMMDDGGGIDRDPGEPRIFAVTSNDMEILGPGKDDRMILPLAEAKDLQLKMSMTSGQLVYELRVPLVRDARHPNGIATSLPLKVGVGLETTKVDAEGMRERMAGMAPPGGERGEMPPGEGGMPRSGGMGGGRGGPGGRHEGLQRENTPQSLSVWATVTLAGR